MNKLKLYNPLLLTMLGIFIVFNFVSCEDDEVSFENKSIINNNIGLTYENLTSYPYLADILTNDPTFSISTSAYSFKLIEVRLSDGTPANLSDFSIDTKTGAITIKNSGGILLTNETYSFDIGIQNVNGIIRYDNIFVLNVLGIPLDYTISNTTYETNFLENTDVATVTFADTSVNGDVLSGITYSLENTDEGFSINATTGVISKTVDATPGSHQISVRISSNLGSILFENVLTVTVGDAPIINYVQADGTTELTNVTLSPWTTYTSNIPVLNGMNAVTYEIILPSELSAGSIIANADGSITVLENQNLPIGVYSLGVIATNSSNISATFNNLFSLTVETRWEDSAVFFEDFNNATTDNVTPNSYNSQLHSYPLIDSEINFQVAYNSGKGVYTAKLADVKIGGVHPLEIDTALILELNMLPEWRQLRVRFTEGFGFGDDRLGWFERSLLSSHSIADIESSAFDVNNWNIIMDDSDTSWSGTSIWGTVSSDADLNQIPFKDVEITPGNSSVYLNWRINKNLADANPTKGAQFLIDSIEVEVSNAFNAEEE